jgi:hypothetical protein
MNPKRHAARGCLAACLAIGCGSDSTQALAPPGGGLPGPAPTLGPVYAMMTQVYGEDDRSVYVTLSDTLDLTEVSLDQAREFSGVANFTPFDGRLLISSGDAPLITEFEVTPELGLQEGRTISFTGFPLQDNANLYYQFFVDENTAYLPFDGFRRILWNPTTFELSGVMENSNVPREQDGLMLEAGGNRNSVQYAGSVLQAFFYHDENWDQHAPNSPIAIYDRVSHEETGLIDAPCPGLGLATQDEAGNTYFGSWGYLPTAALYGYGPAPCIVRVTPELTLDPAFTTDLRDWTDGRYASNFRYIGAGMAMANVLHHEELGADFSAAPDVAVSDLIAGSGSYWRLWLFDVEQRSGRPVEGIDLAIGAGAQFAVLDGRTFVFLPYADYSRSRVYEIDAEGLATERLDVLGDVFKWVRVR